LVNDLIDYSRKDLKAVMSLYDQRRREERRQRLLGHLRWLGWVWVMVLLVFAFGFGLVVLLAFTFTLCSGQFAPGLQPTWWGLLCIPAGVIIISLSLVGVRAWANR
jgi:uncharacterized membrane protein (DUF485 family)